MTRVSPPPARRLASAVLSALLLGAAVWLGVVLISDLRTLQEDKTALAELRDVKYGLFNAELWVEQLGDILARKIDSFEVTEESRPGLKLAVEQIIDRLLVEVDGYLQRRNHSGSNWIERVQGGLQQRVQDWLIDFDSLRARVPYYADQVLFELEQPHTKAELKGYLTRVLNQATATSLAQVDYSAFNAILMRYGCDTGVDCTEQLQARIEAGEQCSRQNALLLLGLVLALFLLNLLWTRTAGRLLPEVLGLLTGAALVLLAIGVLTPMLEIEARITELSFLLLDQPVRFTDQVLYFQSKSIMDVVVLLARTGAADMLLVAVLITLFSLVFPTLKTLASLLYYRAPVGTEGGAWRSIVRFFALRSGKWSMADVLVVAVFMAFIGFDGLIDSQLLTLAGGQTAPASLDVLTTNGTRLSIGFFMFLSFVLGSLTISTLLEADRAPSSSKLNPEPNRAPNPERTREPGA
ncbi:paraquat-inducible protein A [Thiorhodovibrio frisius]|uniref:Putative paraquat-inducible protein A n=1 Tax=Thiorhodovibrio frisius TaxID=631362 RepID=H8Z731_9GAMM|nr:paraquat-inducible protein A [Thiorhodovibrio frisius]EIC20830.1 putative paraquat-inducible protein A [Thiorhodovibrio frisius]WPL21882.1 putative paraquat-inducible protein A [Thiorhodovibrio frisius]